MSHVTTPQELQAVREELQALDLTDKGHKKRGPYRSISVTDKFLVTRYAVYSTPTKAIAAHPHLSVPYSSLTGWMSKYRTAKRTLGREPVNAKEAGLIKKQTKLPLMGKVLDNKVAALVKGLRAGGSAVTATTMAMVIHTTLLRSAPWELKENGGKIDPNSRSLRCSFYRRHNLCRRAATSSRKNLSSAEIKAKHNEFIRSVNRKVKKYSIPDALVINWDETSLPAMPTTAFTINTKSDKTVRITGKDDKRNVTGLLAVARNGTVLPAQILYKGKTERCHPPHEKFPKSWDIHHTANHWSTSKSKDRFVELVVLPYIHNVRSVYGLSEGSDTALVLFDHHTSNLKNPPYRNEEDKMHDTYL